MVKWKERSSGMSKTHGLIPGAITDISKSKEASTCAVLLNAHRLPLFSQTLNYKLSRFLRTSWTSLECLDDTGLGTIQTLNFSKMLNHWNKFSNISVSVFIYTICMIINYVVNNRSHVPSSSSDIPLSTRRSRTDRRSGRDWDCTGNEYRIPHT